MKRFGWLVAAAIVICGASSTYLGGALNLVGGFPATFTLTGTTGVTFPTSGTLATTAGVATALPSVATTIPYCGTGGAGVAQGCSTVQQAAGGTGSTCGPNCLGKLTVNMAVTTDQQVTLTLGGATRWMPGLAVTAGGSITFVMANCTNAVNQSASTGALYRGAGKTNALTAVTTFANLTGATGDMQRVANAANSTAYTTNPLFFAMTSAGSAGTCDMYVMGYTLP